MEEKPKNGTKTRCTMSLDSDVVKRVDRLVDSSVFASRSHAAERALKLLLAKHLD
jgi:metal-responsive CopG/Arc/MetJ family transcriptional regulator